MLQTEYFRVKTWLICMQVTHCSITVSWLPTAVVKLNIHTMQSRKNSKVAASYYEITKPQLMDFKFNSTEEKRNGEEGCICTF